MADTTLQVIFTGVDKTLSSTASGIGGAFGKLGGAVTAGLAIGATAIAGLGAATVGLGARLVGLGSDAEEMQSKFNVVFANVGGEVTAALDEFAAAAGRSKYELREMASTFGDTLKPMGFTESQAGDLSVQMTQLATDLGSFNNMPMDEALQRLQGTLIGSHENALAFGVIINENTLKAELAAQGWDKLTGAELEQAKVQARINLLMAGTTDAQGDAIRTAGGWANQTRALKARMTDFATELGSKLLPAMTPLLGMLGDIADWAMPQVTAAFDAITPILGTVTGFITDLFAGLESGMSPLLAFSYAWGNAGLAMGLSTEQIQKVRDAITNVIAKILEIKTKIEVFLAPIANWIKNNIQLKDVLIALGIVIGGVVLSALASLVVAIAPIIAAGAALIAVVALIRQAWENDWGGIQGKVASVVDWFQNTLLPWFQVNIPIAIQFLSDAWTNVLKPAIEAVWLWLSTVLMPFLTDTVFPWLQEKIPAALETLRSFWEDTLLPGIKAVWNFLSVRMMPIWEAIGEFLGVAFPLVLTALQGIWENVLLPAMTSVWTFLTESLGPAFQWLKDSLIDPASAAFETLSGTIQRVADWIGTLTDKLSSITLPDWMTPGSPTPWENGLVGVQAALQKVAKTGLPALNMALNATATPAFAGGGGLVSSSPTRQTVINMDFRGSTGVDVAKVKQAVREAMAAEGRNADARIRTR